MTAVLDRPVTLFDRHIRLRSFLERKLQKLNSIDKLEKPLLCKDISSAMDSLVECEQELARLGYVIQGSVFVEVTRG